MRTEVSEPSAGGAGGECEVQAQIWPNPKQEPMRASSTPSMGMRLFNWVAHGVLQCVLYRNF